MVRNKLFTALLVSTVLIALSPVAGQASASPLAQANRPASMAVLPPPQNVLCVGAIDPTYKPDGPGFYRLETIVQIEDLIGAPVADAQVVLAVTPPTCRGNCQGLIFTGVTDGRGMVRYSGVGPWPGTYTFTVLRVNKVNWTYDPLMTMETQDYLIIQ